MDAEHRSPRATILYGLAPEVLAVGYDDERRRWVTAAAADEPFDPLPPLDGVLLVGPAATGAADDFGHVVSHRPSAVLRPGSVADVAAMVRYCRDHRLRVAARGTAHTTFGQSQVADGVRIDLTTLARVLAVDDRAVEVEAGATWNQVLRASLAKGYTPPVLTDHLDLSVGGTLSVGGVSGTSWRHGAQVDNVEWLDLVTGDGLVVSCSETTEPELFDAVLAGQGQCALIVRARLHLVPAPDNVRVFNLIYADIASLLADMRTLMADGRFDYLVGLFLPSPDGWIPMLEAVSFFSAPHEPDTASLLAGLGFVAGGQPRPDLSYFDYANRVVLQLGDLQAVDLLAAPHPWIDLFIPGPEAERFLADVLAGLTPPDVGRSFPVLLYPFKRARLRRPLLRVPDGDDFFLFDVLRAATPGAQDVASMLEQNRRLFEQNRDLGGRHYPISAIHLSSDEWRRHFEPHWTKLESAKRRFDADNVLTPGPGIFAG